MSPLARIGRLIAGFNDQRIRFHSQWHVSDDQVARPRVNAERDIAIRADGTEVTRPTAASLTGFARSTGPHTLLLMLDHVNDGAVVVRISVNRSNLFVFDKITRNQSLYIRDGATTMARVVMRSLCRFIACFWLAFFLIKFMQLFISFSLSFEERKRTVWVIPVARFEH